MSESPLRFEHLTRGNAPCESSPDPVRLRIFASAKTGARGLSTGMLELPPASAEPPHTHNHSEVLITLSSLVVVEVEGRSYRLHPFDALHVPAGIAHAVTNPGPQPASLHWSQASANPDRDLVPGRITPTLHDDPPAGASESLVRFDKAQTYELAPGTLFRDLFAKRLGSRGICGGHGIFQPGTGLPCHIHHYDESITIVQGQAVCQVAGQEYLVSDNDTACIPTGRPHRFFNSTSQPMAMIWVYAGDEPDRVILDPGFCTGILPLSQLPAGAKPTH